MQRKRPRSVFGEPVWDIDADVELASGAAEAANALDPDRVAAVLWLPSPEFRSGWREYYVYPKMVEAERRPLGFRKE
jgi:hypothetical protein